MQGGQRPQVQVRVRPRLHRRIPEYRDGQAHAVQAAGATGREPKRRGPPGEQLLCRAYVQTVPLLCNVFSAASL